MPQPMTQLSALTEAARQALDRRDWLGLRFNAQLMLREDPESPVALSCLGIAFVQMGLESNSPSTVQQGVAYHRSAVQRAPDSTMAAGNYAVVLIRADEHERALAVLDRAIQSHPDEFILWNYRAQAELGLGRLEEADRSVARALGLVAYGELVALRIDRLYLGQRTIPLALPLFVGALRLDAGYACEENDFEIYGTGASFHDALMELCEDFVVLVEEYVDTADPLDEGAEALAQRLRDHLKPDVLAGLVHAH